MTLDPFDTARWRAAVLRAWSEQPSRFREDANLEEDFAHGYYRDRVVVELAQNAADAARRAGGDGRLWLRLTTGPDGETLSAANTGAPLDGNGVHALATLRASAKATTASSGMDSVGRFGVGFAAIRAVSDEVAVLSSTGGVRFSQADASAELARVLDNDGGRSELATEVARRDGRIPALRLPFAAQGQPPVGYDTVVIAQLTDQLASDAVRRQLDAVDDLLILSLPGLSEIIVEVDEQRRVITGADQRWLTARLTGQFAADLLADRPIEERERTSWSVTWALPRPGGGVEAPQPGVIHAPTPTDEPCTLPAVLIATFPLDPTRRHIAPGPITDRLIEHAAHCYADALERVVADPTFAPDAIWQLIPVGLPASELDEALCSAARRAIRSRPILPPSASEAASVRPAAAVRPDEAVTLTGPGASDDGIHRAVALMEPALVRVDTAAKRTAARALDIASVTLADAVDRLPSRWPIDVLGSWYAAVLPAARHDPLVREALATVPVPMASGRTAIGARGVIVLDDADAPGLAEGHLRDGVERLARWGVPFAAPGVAPELFGLLGADVVSIRDLFDGAASAVRSVLEERIEQILDGQILDDDMLDGPDPDATGEVADWRDAALLEVTDTVLSLLPAGTVPVARPWTDMLPVPGADGQLCPASDAVFAHSWLAEAQGANAQPVAASYVQRWGAEALIRLGVPTHPPVRSIADVAVGADLEDLDDPPEDWLAYCDYVLEEAGAGRCAEVLIIDGLADVTDLPAALPHLLADPGTRAALLGPVRVRDEDGVRTVRPYASWWCSDRSGGPFALESATPLVRALLPPLPAYWRDAIDAESASATIIGAVARLADLDGRDWPTVLAASGVRAREGAWTTPEALQLWRALAERCLSDDGWDVSVPDVVGALIVDNDMMVGAPAEVDTVTIVDAPCQLPLVDGPVILVPASISTALSVGADLPMAGAHAAQRAGADFVDLPATVAALLPEGLAGWWHHDDLVVDGVSVRWWVDPQADGGAVHAVSPADAGMALAWASGHWSGRELLAESLMEGPSVWSVDDVFGWL